jgi:Dihydroorotase and related cyclic amidohydrolases
MNVIKISAFLLLFLSAQPAISETLLIEDVTVISPERETPLFKAYVLIKDGMIAEVSSKKIDIRAPVVRLDGRGRYLIPGLIDSHVHLAKVPSMTGRHKNNTRI